MPSGGVHTITVAASPTIWPRAQSAAADFRCSAPQRDGRSSKPIGNPANVGLGFFKIQLSASPAFTSCIKHMEGVRTCQWLQSTTRLPKGNQSKFHLIIKVVRLSSCGYATPAEPQLTALTFRM